MGELERMIAQGKKIIIFGAGNWGRQFLNDRTVLVEYFLDNSPEKQGTFIGNIPIYAPEHIQEADTESTVVVIANARHAEEIRRQLVTLWSGRFFSYRPQDAAPDSYLSYMRYNVTYRCNSHCQTCCIWKHPGGYEMLPEEFSELLNTPDMRHMRRLYITGGEPTLRRDFARYIEATVKNCPQVEFINTVTNAIMVDKTVKIMTECNEICRQYGIPFYVSVSIDGTKEIHDSVRGVPNGFDKAVTTIKRLKEAGVECSVSTTISALNAWCMEELKVFFQQNGIDAFFKRSQNIEFFDKKLLSDAPFDYTKEVNHQITLFLYKILAENEKFSHNWIVAYNTIAMMHGGKRMLECGYTDASVSNRCAFLMQDGSYIFCANSLTASKKLGKENIVFEHKKLLQQMDFFIHTKCEECSGDTFSRPSKEMMDEIEQTEYWEHFLSCDGFQKYEHGFIPYASSNLKHSDGRELLIVGAFGREDVVEGVCLQAYIKKRVAEDPEISVTVCSEYPIITKWTLAGLPSVKVVPAFDREFLPRVGMADDLALFTSERNGRVLWAEKLARKRGIKVAYVSGGTPPGGCLDTEGEPLAEVFCCIDAGRTASETAMKQAAELADLVGLRCHFYSVNNFCYGKFGDNRDTYFALAPKIFGENWEVKCTIDEQLAAYDKLCEAMLRSKFVVVVGEAPVRLADALGIVPYEI